MKKYIATIIIGFAGMAHADLVCYPGFGDISDTPSGWYSSRGSNGIEIRYPGSWYTAEGKNGQRIAYPSNWYTTEGQDGARIGYPSGWYTDEGSDGRRIAYPSGWYTATDSHGRRYAYPSSGCQDPCELLVKEMNLSADLLPHKEKLIKLIGPSICKM